MLQLLGLTRVVIIIVVILLGLIGVLIAGLIPIRIRGMRLASWVCFVLPKIFNIIFNVRVECSNVEAFYAHRGLIFPNHVSYLEPVILYGIIPGRFLAAIEVKRRPVIGWLAQAVETVFVTREDRASRMAVRQQVSTAFRQHPLPPIVIFPEGRLGPGDQLNPFRYGAFEIAKEGSIPFMPCAIQYERNDIAVWFGGAGETLLGALWRLAKFPGPLRVRVQPLAPIVPRPHDSVAELATKTKCLIEIALGYES